MHAAGETVCLGVETWPGSPGCRSASEGPCSVRSLSPQGGRVGEYRINCLPELIRYWVVTVAAGGGHKGTLGQYRSVGATGSLPPALVRASLNRCHRRGPRSSETWNRTPALVQSTDQHLGSDDPLRVILKI